MRGIITSLRTRSGGRARADSSAACPSATASTSHCGASKAHQVLAHVGVVVGDEDRSGLAAATASAKAERPPAASAAVALEAEPLAGFERDGSAGSRRRDSAAVAVRDAMRSLGK